MTEEELKSSLRWTRLGLVLAMFSILIANNDLVIRVGCGVIILLQSIQLGRGR